ncbi:uncharacterized protein LOC112562362 isoform X1 [Pomacea canaliculata]|uniref:uncharacterized protein LOC112562362 isoform X1 n=1 Tax=Pomacea canaliculata TaxID=400727 RepID=UPI000D733932|nr:uncharacterized protein LOC112562362 isoform X1 [Pomacea canaliculata]
MASIATPLIVAFVLLGIGLLLHIIGFAVPQWHDQEWMTSERYLVRVTYGLWRYCYNSWHRRSMDPEVCTSIVDSQYDRGYTRATQFFETVGLIAAIASIVLLLLGVCVATCRDRRILPILSGICSIAAAGCILLGTVIFGANDAEEDHLSWAFALCIVGGIFFGVAGVLIIVASVVLKR